MIIKPWNIYLTRGGKSQDAYLIEEARPILITRWVEREKMRSTWEGWAWWSAKHKGGDLSGPFWLGVHGNIQPDGRTSSLDITKHLISVRDLVTRKLNPPPIEWTLRAYARYSERDFFF